MEKPLLVSLDTLRPGARAVARRLLNGAGLANRLASMGLSLDTELEVLVNGNDGPLLIRVRRTRIGLARAEAAKVLVEVRE